MKNFVFLGDSVTDCSRKRAQRFESELSGLGNGWVQYVNKTIAASNHDVRVWNRGFAGSLTKELMSQEAWWPVEEAQPIEAEVSSLMIGINDIWHPFWRGGAHDVEGAVQACRDIVIELQKRTNIVIVIEPIALPVGDVTQQWWPFLSKLTEAQEQLCKQEGIHWLPLQEALMKSAQGRNEDYLVDGVHPTDLGHRWIAKQWINYAVSKNLL
jgi:lysophospholipase L1-like esterase